MNKRFSTLLAVALMAGGLSASAQDLNKDKFYHLQTTAVGGATGQTLNLTLTKNYRGTTADSIVAVVSSELAAQTDSALWKAVPVKDAVTGQYTWTITNKAVPAAQFSFAAGSNMKGDNAANLINGLDATAMGLKKLSSLSGSLKFVWGTPAAVTTGNALVSSFIPSKDSTLYLAVNVGNGETFVTNKTFPLIQVMAKTAPAAGAAGQTNPAVSIQAVAPAPRTLTVKELNSKMAISGFQLFFYHKNVLTAENNALTNVVFQAEGLPTDTDVTLKAKLLTPKRDKAGVAQYLYAYVDTISYSAVNNLPMDGTRMTFRVDTLPRENNTVVLDADAYTFNFVVDPSSANDSVVVYVKRSYDPTTGTAPRTFSTALGTPFFVQIDALGGTSSDKSILTTGLVGSTTTRIAFTGGTPIAAPLKNDKVYSVKYVMKDASAKDKNGKYRIANLLGNAALSNNVYTHVPATQFVFDEATSTLKNREFATVATSALFIVDASKNLYADMTDTMEIVAMDVAITNATIGYANISKDSLTNYAFTFDYISGVLEGRSIVMKNDSSVAALLDGANLFRLEQVADLAIVGGSADNGTVAQLKNKAYKVYSKDKKTIIYKDTVDNKLKMTHVGSAAAATAETLATNKFYLKEIENAKEFILMNELRDEKFNVNSTSEVLEKVALTLGNNAFAIQTEVAPEYVLNAAKKHLTFANLRGDKLAADSKNFAMFRKEGELKANYTADDFKLWVDSANTSNKAQPAYFILSGAMGEKDSPVLEGNFLRVMSDSTSVAYKAANGATRLAFVPAKRVATGDSLLVNYKNEKLTKADSVGFKGKNDAAEKIKQFQFKIQYTNVDGQYLLHDSNGNYLATYNDVLCLATGVDGAQLVKLTTADAPVANEEIAAGTVKVIAGEGVVTVYGAAGKKVTVSDVLGKATTSIATSDSQVFAAAQGVVIVAVEGETTVKAVVK